MCALSALPLSPLLSPCRACVCPSRRTQWKRIDLAEVDWAAGSEHEPIALYEAGLGVKDVTPASKRPLRERR